MASSFFALVASLKVLHVFFSRAIHHHSGGREGSRPPGGNDNSPSSSNEGGNNDDGNPLMPHAGYKTTWKNTRKYMAGGILAWSYKELTAIGVTIVAQGLLRISASIG